MTNSDERNTGESSSPSETPIEKLLRKHGLTEQEFDDVAQRRFNGFYPLAYKYFGISRREVEDIYKADESTENTPGQKSTEKVVDSGISVRIADRAIQLSGALRDFSNASQIEGFDRALYTPHGQGIRQRYNDEKITSIVEKQKDYWENGRGKFRSAFGSQAMIDSGVDPVEVEFDEQMEANSFIDEYTGTENAKKRGKLYDTLDRQSK
jgi:hypothetical protein